MGVGLVIGEVAHEIGSADFLKGFFSTISYYLEPGGWGTRYPELMLQLYQGKLDAQQAKSALKDVNEIRKKLGSIKRAKIVWDIDDPDAESPWGASAVPANRDLSNCFITSNGRDLFDVLIECLNLLSEKGGELTIEPY